MKLIHISDLHIGKYLKTYSMLEDQRHILSEIIRIVKEQKPDAVCICGDIYDKSNPSGEAIAVANKFLSSIADTDTELFVIYGNHDQAEKIAFASELMRSNIHFSPVFDGKLPCVKVKGVNIYSLPFIKPLHVKRAFKDIENIDNIIGNDYTKAAQFVFEHNEINPSEKNVLLAHQFVSGASISGSEEITSVGTLDNIGTDIFSAFDYVALGHLHGRQEIKKNIHYCGSPLKYSISEEKQNKSVSVVEIDNEVKISYIPLVPLHDIRTVEGYYADIMKMEKSEDFICVSLLDEQTRHNAYSNIQSVFPNMIDFKYKNITYGNVSTDSISQSDIQNTPMIDLLCDYYKQVMTTEIDNELKEIALKLCEEAEGKQ